MRPVIPRTMTSSVVIGACVALPVAPVCAPIVAPTLASIGAPTFAPCAPILALVLAFLLAPAPSAAAPASAEPARGEELAAQETIPGRRVDTENAASSGSSAKVGPRRRAAPPETFREGLSAYYGGDYINAASRMYDYIATNDETVENRAWAKFFLGASLARLGFSQGAAEHLFDVTNDRTRPEILPDALTEIEELMRGPYDEGLLFDRLLVDSDFGYLPSGVSGFVRYHQGLADLRAGRTKWAKRLFDAIPSASPYFPRAAYALGVDHLKRDEEAEAVRAFRAALAAPEATREVRNLARLALARILYGRELYDAADALYEEVEVPELTAAEGQLLLERAWTAYWRGDNRRAMGLLYALEAPSYADLHAPEKFLLRALIYQRLCHYIPAKRAIRRFRSVYGPTLDHIRRREDLREDPVLRRAALSEDGPLARLMAHRRRLAGEARRIDGIGGAFRETGLDESLREMYRLASTRADLRIDTELFSAAREAAEELVTFEEQMYLLDYEIGLAIYRRLEEQRARRGQEAPIDIPLAGDEAIYPFVGEFWNDELSRFDFLIENRCFDEGGGE